MCSKSLLLGRDERGRNGSRAGSDGAAPVPRRGGSRYKLREVGREDASGVVDQGSGSSPAGREARAQSRAAQRSLSSLPGALGEDVMPESARESGCWALTGTTSFNCVDLPSFAKEWAGGAMATSCVVTKFPVVD